jgi:hypothetical protein
MIFDEQVSVLVYCAKLGHVSLFGSNPDQTLKLFAQRHRLGNFRAILIVLASGAPFENLLEPFGSERVVQGVDQRYA